MGKEDRKREYIVKFYPYNHCFTLKIDKKRLMERERGERGEKEGEKQQ